MLAVSDFESFKKENLLLMENICRDFFHNGEGSHNIKKEALVVKNFMTILNTTLRLSGEMGFQAMTLRSLSRESGLSMGALYNYFSSKEDLLKIIHSYGQQTTRLVLEKAVEGETDTHQKLRKLIRTHLYLSEMMQPYFMFFFMETRNLKPEDRKVPKESERYTEQILLDLLDEGKASGIYAIKETFLATSLIKALQQEWYLKRPKYAKRNVSIERYLEFIMESIEAVILAKRGVLDMAEAAKQLLDRPAGIRSGEELDPAGVHEFVTGLFPEITGEIKIHQYPSGYSNLTYLVSIGARDFILRRPPFGTKAKTAHDMAREYRVLSALNPVFPCSPRPIAFCDDEGVIGARFYLMERINGIILRRDLPPGLSFTPAEARRLSENLIATLCRLHSIDPRTVGLEDLGKGEGYVSRQVGGWSKRYLDAMTPDAPGFEKVMSWLHDKMPQRSPAATIIHNDYKLDNAVLDPSHPTEIIGLLDWEMATIGDPLMDLGSSLAYWVQKDDPPYRVHLMPTNLDGMLTRKEQVALYADRMGITIDNFDFYHCFGLFRLAVICQQIYYRYFHGQTRDPRFKELVHMIRSLEQAAKTVVAQSDL